MNFENKLEAKDQAEQLQDYISWARQVKSKRIVAVYLTLDGHAPTGTSLSEEE
jgi:DNA-binding transcriptional MocR family regulator